MKISYRPQAIGAGAYTLLADDTAGSLITSFSPAMNGQAQIDPGAFAANAYVAARGNRVWELTFTVEREHADAATASMFLATHAAAIPDAVDLKIEQDATAVYLANSVFAGYDPRAHGRSTVIQYRITGQNLTSTAP